MVGHNDALVDNDGGVPRGVTEAFMAEKAGGTQRGGTILRTGAAGGGCTEDAAGTPEEAAPGEVIEDAMTR